MNRVEKDAYLYHTIPHTDKGVLFGDVVAFLDDNSSEKFSRTEGAWEDNKYGWWAAGNSINSLVQDEERLLSLALRWKKKRYALEKQTDECVDYVFKLVKELNKDVEQ